jgi:hypothetical protein
VNTQKAKHMMGGEEHKQPARPFQRQPKGQHPVRGQRDFIYYVHCPPSQAQLLPNPAQDPSRPIKCDNRWVKPADILEGRVVMGRADVYRIQMANTKGPFTVAVAPCVSPLLEISSFVKFRVVRGVHPQSQREFPLAVDVQPMRPPAQLAPQATVSAAMLSKEGRQPDSHALIRKLEGGYLKKASSSELSAAEGPTSLITLAQDCEVASMSIEGGWDSKADLAIISAQVYHANHKRFQELGCCLVKFPISLSGFSPNSSVQIVGLLEDVPMRFEDAEGNFYIHRENFVITSCCFDMLIGWPVWQRCKAQINYDVQAMELNFPGVPTCSVPYACRAWSIHCPDV